jgi:excisionase family DNA binding protein
LGKPFTGSIVKWIRYRYQIPLARLVRPEELTVQQVAERFRVSPNVVYYWIERGVIEARRLNAGSPYWITLDETDEQKLRDWVRNSCRIQRHPQRDRRNVHYEITVGIESWRILPFPFGISTFRAG